MKAEMVGFAFRCFGFGPLRVHTYLGVRLYYIPIFSQQALMNTWNMLGTCMYGLVALFVIVFCMVYLEAIWICRLILRS